MRRTFILMFLMMFCSIGFGQNHWNQVVNGNAFPDHLDVVATVSIDGSSQTSSNLQLAAFCGDELRGITTLVYEENLGVSLAYMQLFGKNDDKISFRVYDETNKREYTTLTELNYQEDFNYGYGLNGKLGHVNEPYEVSFSAVASVPAQGYDVIYETLPAAVEAAQAEQTVTLLKSVEGAGLVINKNVTVDFGGNTYTINQAVGSTGTESQGFQLLPSAENVTLKNGNIAVVSGTNVIWMINDYAKNLTIEGMTFDCAGMKLEHSALMGLVINNANATGPKVEFKGNVSFTNLPEGAQQILLENNTSLTAGEGWMNAIEPETGYVVVYNNGDYTVEKAVAQNVTTGEYYLTLVEAVSSATADDEVKLLAAATGAGLVINKNVTVDFGANTYTINQAVGSAGTESQGFQLLKDNDVTIKNGKVAIAEGTNVKWMFNAYANLTLENVNVDCNNMATPVEGEKNYVLVANNGGGATPKVNYSGVNITNFNGSNAPLYIDPTTTLVAESGLNVETVKDYVVVYNNGAYTVQEAEARIGDVYYTTFDAAHAAAKADETITILKTVVLSENRTLDLANVKVESEAYPTAFRIINDANITVNDATITTVEGGLYNFILGASDSSSAGNLTIKDGTFVANTTVASVTKGTLTIEGGKFSLVEGTTDYRYLINCIDANYSNGSAKVSISGGTFHNWNPQDNAAETGGHANFCADGYAATETAENVWEVKKAVAKVGETLFATLQDAVNAADATNNEIVLIDNVELGAFVTIDKSVTLNLGEYKIARENGTALYVNGENVEVTIDGKGTVSGYQAVFVRNGIVTIKGGNYVGNPEAVYVIDNGHVVIEGGRFETVDTNTNFVLNEYDATRDATIIEVKGGTFVAFDPENNAAEGAGTNFCADGYISDYDSENDVYTVRPGVYVAQTETGAKFETLQDAVNAGTEVTLLSNVIGAGVKIDKDVTIDFATFTYSFNEGVGSGTLTSNGFQILGGNVVLKNGTLNVNEADASEFYILVQNYTNLTVENMTLDGTNLDKWSKVENNWDSYTLSNNSGNVYIKGSTIIVNNDGVKSFAFDVDDNANYTSKPVVYVENLEGRETLIQGQIEVDLPNNLNISGGLFIVEIEEAWCADGYIPTTVEKDGTIYYTVKAGEYVARVGEQGYETFDAALEAANASTEEDAITILKTIVLSEEQTIDFSGIEVNSEVNPAFRITEGANVTVENGNMNTAEGGYNFILGASDGSSHGNLTIKSGKYHASTTVASVTKGTLAIEGGEFSATPYNGDCRYLINCIDANYSNGSAKVSISGGTFHNWNPQDNAAETGGHANFCAEGYAATETVENLWTVLPAVAKIGETLYATLADATKAAVTGDTVTLLCDINGSEVTVDHDQAKKITIDLGGYKLSSTGTTLIAFRGGTELTITNGTVYGNGASGGTLRATYKATLILGDNLTVTSGPQATAIFIQDGRFFVYPNTENVKVEGGIDCIKVQDNALEVSLASGTYTEDVAEWCAEGYYSHYNDDNTWTIKEGTFVAQIGEQKYLKLQAAIDAVQDGETIKLIADFGETVTIKQVANKSFTIDGAKDAESNYVFSGTINVDGNNRPTGAETLTIRNIDFVNTSATTYAYFINATKNANGGNSEVHNLTVENCYFESTNWHYAIATRHPYNLVVKGCEAKSVYYFIYNPQGGQRMTIEDCDVTSATYGIGAQKCKEVVVKNYNYTGKAAGFYGRATSNEPTATLENVNITTTLSGQSAVTYWKNDDGTTSKTYTFNFVDENRLTTPEGTASFAVQNETNAPYQILLGATDATLDATEGLNIESGVEGYTVEYADGVYSLRKLDYVAAIGETQYESLQAAIDAAVDGQTVTLLKDINYTFEDTKTTSEGYPILVDVTGKAITLDFANYAINVNHQSTTDRIYAVVYVEDGASLTVKNGSIDVDVDDNTPKVAYMFWKRGTTGTLTIESGNFHMDNSEDSMVYTNGDEIVTVNGGTFKLDMVGTRQNGFPCIFNAAGNNERNIIVNGGTYNYDVNHQHWANEVKVPQTLALQNDGNGIWTVVPSVAYVVESIGNYERYVGYATLAEAVAANQKDAKVTVIAENTIANTVVVEKDLTIDFAGYEVSCAVTPAIRIQDGATVIAQNGNMNTTGYNFILGASDSSSAGNLTIEGGIYHAQTSVASVTMGNLVIEGGEFSVEPYQENYAYLINCIDANYNNGAAKVAISGGTFHKWNPQNNAAEGANTNFCAPGYAAVETAAGSNIWTVVPMQGIELHAGWNWFSSYIDIDGAEGLGKLQDALAGNATIIKGQKAYTSYSATYDTWNGALTSISNKEMYMIEMNDVYSLSLTGDMLDPSTIEYELVKGWNWISYPISEAYAIVDVMNAEFGMNDQVKSHHDGFAEYYNGNWYGDLQTLTPGRGYMYGHIAEENLKFAYTIPARGSKSELKPNITAENNRWVPASSQFVNNMTMVAMVEGVNADNYEVAAFVNGEVRGSARPIYIEPLDAYMLFLTIYGNDVEEMTFRYYDLATGEEYALNDRINYADDARVGSIAEPYIFNRGTTGVGENSLSEINIYPNPTTIGTEINLETTCEMVEVYNALGVKIAEYQNVDTIDAIETAGVYVIRVINNGNVQNCRLVVK